MKILFLTRYGRLGASSRMRTWQYLPWFNHAEIECTVAPLFDDNQLIERYHVNRYGFTNLLQSYSQRLIALWNCSNYDAVWIEKEALPWLPAWFERLMLRSVPYILDYDDAVFHNYDLHASAMVRYVFGGRLDRLMAGAHLVVAGNAYLANRARKAGAPRIEIIPTVIDLERYSENPVVPDKPDPIHIAWIGSPSTTRYLDLLRVPLTELSRRHSLKLQVIGGTEYSTLDVDVEIVPWSEETEVASLLACDIGVMPLFDSPWERGKCGYKLIQYMACGLPVVASPVGVNCEIVNVGKNGYLADSAEEWIEALSLLINDSELRHHIGSTGRTLVEKKFCLQQVAPRLVQLLHEVKR